MPADEIELTCEEAMEGAVEFFKKELRGIRTGRASTGLVEHLRIEVASYGSRGAAALRHLHPDPTMTSSCPSTPAPRRTRRGIQNSDIGITPMGDGR